MLTQARRRTRDVPHPTRLRFEHATLPAFPLPSASFDAIATHFFLDCFPVADLAIVISSLGNAARPRARWLVTDFSIPAAGWRRHRARAIHAAMYAFFRPVTRIRARRVTAPDALLHSHGFNLSARRTFELGLLQSDLWTRC